jgi:cell division protein FtsB
MREFQHKKRLRRILYSKAAIIVLTFFLLVLANATWGVYKKQEASAANTVQAKNSLKKLKDRESVLTAELSRLDTEEGVEEEIRAKYGVSKPGEELLVIVDDKNASTTEKQPEQSWWNKFKGLFK